MTFHFCEWLKHSLHKRTQDTYSDTSEQTILNSSVPSSINVTLPLRSHLACSNGDLEIVTCIYFTL